MRRIVVSVQVTLDGYIEGPDGDLSWMNLGGGIWEEVEAEMAESDAVIFGRVAYEGFAAYWPQAGANPASPPDEVKFSRWIQDVRKYVVTTTLREAGWNNSHIIRDDVADTIAALKREPGRNILVFGGGGIISSLTKYGLVDDYHIHIFPLLLGSGKPLFKDVDTRKQLRACDVKAMGGSIVGLYYENAEAQLIA